jgi:hypothetical protein
MPWRYIGEWRYSSTILDLDIRSRWVVSFTPRPLYSRGKSPWYPLDRRLGGPQSWSVPCGVEINLLPLPGIEPRTSIPSLYWLSYPGFIDLSKYIKINRLKWAGNVIRINNNRIIKRIFDIRPEERRGTGRPKLRWGIVVIMISEF